MFLQCCFCHSGPFTGNPHLTGETSGGSRHLSGTVSLERHLAHCLQWLKTRRPHRKHFPTGLLPSERHSTISSLESTQYTSDAMEGSQLQFVKFSVTFSAVPLSMNHTSTRRCFAINAAFRHTTIAHLHSSGQTSCFNGTSMKTMSVRSFHYKQR